MSKVLFFFPFQLLRLIFKSIRTRDFAISQIIISMINQIDMLTQVLFDCYIALKKFYTFHEKWNKYYLILRYTCIQSYIYIELVEKKGQFIKHSQYILGIQFIKMF